MSHGGVGADAAIAELISLAVRNRPEAALRLADALATEPYAPHPAQIAACCGLACFIAADYDAAARHGEAALHLGGAHPSPAVQLLAVAARLMASAGTSWAGADPAGDEMLARQLAAGLPETAKLPDTIRWHLSTVMLDALFINGQVDLAVQSAHTLFGAEWDRIPLRAIGGAASLPSLPFLPVRLLFYTGRIGEAEALLHHALQLPEVIEDDTWPLLAESLLALCAGSRGASARARAAARSVAAAFPHPTGYFESSARVLAAHGLAVLGDLASAASEIRSGGGPGLHRLAIVDRALGFEVLLREALQREDRRAAGEHSRAIMSLEAHPAVVEIALRASALVDLANGAAESALRKSEASLARAQLGGALRDAAEGELMRCRALIALGARAEAADGLQLAAISAASRGDTAEHRDAARGLRELGRRVAPPRGSGWAGLGRREREVALLAAQGFSNQAIGDALFLSPRSVAGLVRRVLTAFDVTRRAALAGRLHPHIRGTGHRVAPSFSPRQREVIARIAEGATNAEIAAALGISPRTVERHVAAALTASGAGSRTELVHLAFARVAPSDTNTTAAAPATASTE